ncbi:hypothetical protein GCM10022409_02490 [Hymenobacter glaciei]|uniref:Glycosyltransferase RgtA/B/C/D-like domain-containing protein n=1 Tax=Hymenobacter glaciei TaxID=877209 RepID=A0ABP7T802_9BACT
MNIALALLLNAALLAVLLPWLRQQWQWAAAVGWRWVFAAGIVVRVAVGVGRNVPLKLDAQFMSGVSNIVTARLWAAPGSAWQLLTQSVTTFPTPSDGLIVYQNSSNTWTLIKLLALLNLASLGTGWLNALYLSLFAFAGCWMLARVLAVRFPGTPAGAGAVALLFWPAVWFWSTGISKEAVLLGSGAWLTARVLSWLYAEDPALAPPAARGIGWWSATVALAGLHVAMRYFFALPLLATLAGLVLGRGLERWLPRRWAAALGLVLVLGGGAWLGPELSVAFRLNKFVNQVIRVYSADVVQSTGRPHFEYPNLRPTAGSIAAHAPQAVANALTQPWLGQSNQPLYMAAGLENLALLLLLAVAGWALVRGRGGHMPFTVVLALSVFCLLLAFLIGITTPNLGSLQRYRSAMLPFLLVLLLQNDYAAATLRFLQIRRSPESGTGGSHSPNA